jgi:hypothetical protein
MLLWVKVAKLIRKILLMVARIARTCEKQGFSVSLNLYDSTSVVSDTAQCQSAR